LGRLAREEVVTGEENREAGPKQRNAGAVREEKQVQKAREQRQSRHLKSKTGR